MKDVRRVGKRTLADVDTHLADALGKIGKRTRAMELPPAIGRGRPAPTAAPIQRQEDPAATTDPSAGHVHQYAPGTDTARYNDCGPAVALMALRSMGLEGELEQLMRDAGYDAPTLQQKLLYIRQAGAGNTDLGVMGIAQVRTALVTILGRMDVENGDGERPGAATFPLLTEGEDTGSGATAAQATEFIRDRTADGSAVMVLGNPTGAAWGWGGTAEGDPRRTMNDEPQIIQPGPHFIYVWRAGSGADDYVVMDPSWSQPKTGIALADVVGFLVAHDDAAVLNVMAVPFAQVAAWAAAPPAQAKAAVGAAPQPLLGATIGGGRPLPSITLARMGRAFGADFTSVRIHEDERAAAAGATAFAQGDDVHFAPGRFAPGTPEGDRLIAHELAHVVQQRQGRVAGGGIIDDRALEGEADEIADRVVRGDEALAGESTATAAIASPAVQRQVDPRAAVTALTALATATRQRAAEILAAGPGTLDVAAVSAELAAVTAQIAALSAEGPADDAGLHLAVIAANDAVVEARQALAVHSADASAATWAAADPTTRGSIEDDLRIAAGAGRGTADYCGMFVKAQFLSAGLNADFRSIFNHADNVHAYFTYNGWATERVHDLIRPFGSEAPAIPLLDYHRSRGSIRRLLTTAEIVAAQAAGTFARVVRAGDVVTFAWDPAAEVADHVAMIRRVTDDGFETIEGNAEVVVAGGTTEWGIGTNQWSSDVAGANVETPTDTFENQRIGARRQRARIFLVGRPSAVDFEAGHSYSRMADA